MDGFEQTMESLVGMELAAVSFMRDYVEFHFDGPVLRALTNPCLEDGGATATFPGPGSRDALCALVGRSVRGVDAHPGVHIRITFADGGTHGATRRSEPYGPDDAHFQATLTAPVQVWE